MSFKWWINIEPEVATEYAGTQLGEYFLNPEIRIDTERKCREKFFNLFGYGSPELETVSSPPLFLTCASVLGATVLFPRDASPMIAERVIKNIKDISRIKGVENIEAAGYIPMLIEQYEYLKKKESITGIIPRFDLHLTSPLGTAILLRGTEIFLDIMLYPNEIKELLEVITATTIYLVKFQEKFTRIKKDTLGMDDDYGGLVSPEVYGEFNFPYMKKVFENFSAQERYLHSETLSKGHLQFLKLLNITNYDVLPYNDLTVKIIKENLPNIFFSWKPETTKDIFSDTPEQVKGKFQAAFREGAPALVLDLCARGIPQANIRAFIEAAKEVENE